MQVATMLFTELQNIFRLVWRGSRWRRPQQAGVQQSVGAAQWLHTRPWYEDVLYRALYFNNLKISPLFLTTCIDFQSLLDLNFYTCFSQNKNLALLCPQVHAPKFINCKRGRQSRLPAVYVVKYHRVVVQRNFEWKL